MFGRLHYYKKEEYCKEHPFFYLYVPGHRYRLEIVASIDTRDASDYYDLPAGEYWDELLDKAIERTAFDFGIPVSPDDHYVTLSTCAYDYQEERWLVIARIDDPEGTLPPLE
jgi:sortase B